MMYLVDTNIWLERLLDQERSEEVGRFLACIPTEQLLMTDFSLHSIGVILTRLDRHPVFLDFVNDVLLRGGVMMVSVEPEAMQRLTAVAQEYGLDFDDAYQYVAAELAGATIVSLDADFDRTERRRQFPADILAEDAS